MSSKEGKLVDAVKAMTQVRRTFDLCLQRIDSSSLQVTLLIISAAGFGQRTPWSAYSFTSIKDEISSYDFSKLAKATTNRTVDNHDAVLPFHISLILTLDKLFAKILTPNIFYAIPFRVPWLTHELDVAKVAFDNLRVHMMDLVSAARSNEGAREANILNRLVQANDAMQAEIIKEAGTLEGKKILTDQEMLSDIFVSLTYYFIMLN